MMKLNDALSYNAEWYQKTLGHFKTWVQEAKRSLEKYPVSTLVLVPSAESETSATLYYVNREYLIRLEYTPTLDSSRTLGQIAAYEVDRIDSANPRFTLACAVSIDTLGMLHSEQHKFTGSASGDTVELLGLFLFGKNVRPW